MQVRMQGNYLMYHGKLGKKDWSAPKCVAYSDESIRPDQKNSLNASEYMDEEKVLDEKMKIVASLLKKSKNAIVYTGAGISSSLIDCYATKAKDSLVQKGKRVTYTNADPAYAHHVIANLGNLGLIKKHINQNHDGFTQLAGLPERLVNEIHGSWLNIASPVIKFSGNLRSDLFHDLLSWEEKTDFCLCMGTSLSGMNADRVVSTPMEKFAGGVDGCYGSVIINLQQTPLDIAGYAPIRVWARIDDAMKLLVKHLGINFQHYQLPISQSDIVIVPYNEKGEYDATKQMILNMQKGAKIKVVHPKAPNYGSIGTITRKDKKGYVISMNDRFVHRQGRWWLPMWEKGECPYISIMNEPPTFQ